MDRVAGKTAIVFGGGQRSGEGVGNGRAISIRLAEEGASVMAVARHIETAEETLNLMNGKDRDRCIAYSADICNETEVNDVFDICFRKYGHIDIVVNNVGKYGDPERFMDMDFSSYEDMMKNNVEGAMHCFRGVYPYMKNNGGSIIQIVSIAGSMIGNHNRFSYSFSKHCMKYLGENMAATFAKDGIRVNNIILGSVNTPLVIEYAVEHGKNREEVIAERNSRVPLKGVEGNAWDTANAVLFLASDEARFITGVSLPVDGGALVCNGRC